MPDPLGRQPKTLLIACGALGREIVDLIRVNHWFALAVTCLPADWHNTPQRIPEGVRRKIHEAREHYDEIVVLYGDCGTSGLLDKVCAEEGVERITGPHCYSFYMGGPDFDALMADDPTTFFLTDYLARYFDRLIIRGLGIDRHPELQEMYFGNYTRLIYLAQTDAIRRWTLRPARRRRGWVWPSRSGARVMASWAASWRERRRGAGTMAALTIVYWRDIPAQVIAKEGRMAEKIQLPERFQVAIDQAAMRGAARDSDAYLAEWRRGDPEPCGDDLAAAAAEAAVRIETEYGDERLRGLVRAGGKAEA